MISLARFSFFAVLILATPVQAQNLQWTSQWGTNRADQTSRVAVDQLGNAYVSGFTYGSGVGGPPSPPDAFVVKYSPTGALLWTHQFGTSSDDYAFAVAADSTAGAYVAGRTNGNLAQSPQGGGDAFLQRLAPDGTVQWTRQFGTTMHDVALCVATSPTGVYVGGDTEGSLAGPSFGEGDYFFAKYNEAGDRLWIKQVGTVGGDVLRGMSVDHAGNLYLGGASSQTISGAPADGGSNSFLSKYDKDGGLQWTTQFDDDEFEVAFDVDADADGNVFVVGNFNGFSLSTSDGFLLKYTSEGVLQWSRHFLTEDLARLSGVAADGQGGSYITSFGRDGAYLSRFDGEGTLSWITRIDGFTDGAPSDVAASVSGNAYAAGYTRGSLGALNAGDYDVFLRKFQIPEPRESVVMLPLAMILTYGRRRESER